MKNHKYKDLLTNPYFVKLWGAQMLSQFSIQIITFFILTSIFSLTQSTIAVSLMWIAGALPALVFGPFVGALVDNFSRRKLLMFSALAQAIVITLLILITGKVYFYYVIIFLYWLFDQVYYPSQQSTVPNLVSHTQLPTVNGLFLLTQQASIVVGFGLGGLFLKHLGTTPTILLAIFNLVIAALLLSRLPHDKPESRAIERGVAAFFQDFVEGYRFVKDHPSILSTIGTIIGTQVIITIISTSLPSFSQQVLNISLNDASIEIVVPAAFGALIATIIMPKLLHWVSKIKIIQLGWLTGGMSLLGLSALGLLIPEVRIYGAILVSFFCGASVATVIVPAQSLLQERTPENIRGRVFGQLGFLLILATTLPLIASAAIADIFGISTVIALLGILLLIGFLLSWFKVLHKSLL